MLSWVLPAPLSSDMPAIARTAGTRHRQRTGISRPAGLMKRVIEITELVSFSCYFFKGDRMYEGGSMLIGRKRHEETARRLP